MENKDREYFAYNDKFCTLTMAEILEKQGLKREAIKIYQVLLEKGGQELIIKERLKRLMYGDNLQLSSSQHNEDKMKGFIKWVDKLKGGSK